MDGYAMSQDGTYWKLTSGSPVFWALSDPNLNMPLWQPWYFPALMPYQHYIPIRVQHLEGAVRAAMYNDAKSEAMGAETYRHMRCHVNADTLVLYLQLLMRYVQQWYMSEPAAGVQE